MKFQGESMFEVGNLISRDGYVWEKVIAVRLNVEPDHTTQIEYETEEDYVLEKDVKEVACIIFKGDKDESRNTVR